MSLLSVDRELTQHSYYAATAVREQSFPALDGEADCDVAVVGGGLAGLSAALELAERGFSVRVLEARQVGFGASGRNGGQAIHGLACDIGTIEAELGMADARRVWDMSIEALDLLRMRIVRHAIDADWRDGWLGVATSPGKARELMRGADHLEAHYGYPLQRIGREALSQWIDSPRYVAATYDARSGHLHPLKYTLGLARAAAEADVVIHEDTPVQRLEGGATPVLHTPHGRVRAHQVLLAGNVYLQGLAGVTEALNTRIMPVGTYIIATEPVGEARMRAAIPCGAAVCDNNFVLDYYRFAADTSMLYGGRVSYSTATPMNLAESMRARMVASLPGLAGAKVTHAWGGFVDITMSRAPDFGRLTGEHRHIYYLQGFSGHGLALTGLAGRVVAEAMTGDASRFDLFARLKHRAFPGGPLLRMPALVLGMAWYRLRDALA